MDIRTWQEAGIRAGSYSARHRARSPFSPLRPAPIAIGSLSTAAIAAIAFVAPGILHGSSAGGSTTLLDGTPNRIAPLAAGTTGGRDPGVVSVTAPSSSATSDSPDAPSSTATSAAAPATSGPRSAHPPVTPPTTSPRSPQPPTTPTLPTTPSPTTPTQPTTPTPTPITPTTPTPPVTPTPPPTTPTTPTMHAPAYFDSTAAVASALDEIQHARGRQGVGGLSVDKLLAKAALVHTKDMARTGDFSHIGSDGSDPYSRAAGVGCFSLSQELIAHGKPGDDVIGSMIRDPASRRALLAFWNGSIGISAEQDPTTGDVYWTIELGW